MKRLLAVLTFAALLLPTTAPAHDGGGLTHKAKYLRAKVARAHGERAPGRDIIRRGLRGGREPSKRQKARYVRQLRALLSPAPYAGLLARTASTPRLLPAGALSPSYAAGGTLEAIAQCESGGDPGAIGGGGKFRGKYQFDYQTWAGVGGSGDPAAAPEAEQDYRAARLYAQRGAAPWPVCGR